MLSFQCEALEICVGKAAIFKAYPSISSPVFLSGSPPSGWSITYCLRTFFQLLILHDSTFFPTTLPCQPGWQRPSARACHYPLRRVLKERRNGKKASQHHFRATHRPRSANSPQLPLTRFLSALIFRSNNFSSSLSFFFNRCQLTLKPKALCRQIRTTAAGEERPQQEQEAPGFSAGG